MKLHLVTVRGSENICESEPVRYDGEVITRLNNSTHYLYPIHDIWSIQGVQMHYVRLSLQSRSHDR